MHAKTGQVWSLVNDYATPGGGGGGGVLRISSDGDDQRIFWGLKFSIPGFFWVKKNLCMLVIFVQKFCSDLS